MENGNWVGEGEYDLTDTWAGIESIDLGIEVFLL